MRWLSQLTWSTLAVDEKGQRRAALSTSSVFGCYSYTNSGRVEKGGEGSGTGLEGENQRREGRGAALALLRWRGEESMGGVVEGRAGVERDTAGKESAGM